MQPRLMASLNIAAKRPLMKCLDLTLPTPAENLACDEALLDAAEDAQGGEVLRFWQSEEYFVVVGYANKVATEVNVATCRARGVPILRRCSGGGTVLQGPGCLNYGLILRIDQGGPTSSIGSANRFILEQNRTAIEALLNCRSRRKEAQAFKSETRRNPKSEISMRGHTDLAVNGRKFSGNSQRRRKKFLLFHGTFLLNLDLSLASELLLMPSRQPDYRENRAHADFLTNLNVSAEEVKAALAKAWRAELPLKNPPLDKTAALAREKYKTREWNFKF